MVIRGYPREVVLDHALRAAAEGLEVRSDWFLSPALAAQLVQLVGNERAPRIRSLLAQLPAGTRYEDVQWFLMCRQRSAAAGNPPATGIENHLPMG
jgi:hypothetical protein